MKLTPDIEKAYQLALKAQSEAYAPYSEFYVGATVKLVGDPKLYSGFNIENSSYGATVCGERVALFSALSQSSSRQIEFIVLVTNPEKPSYPCGICRQVLSEFCSDDKTSFYIGNREGIKIQATLAEVLPHRFKKEDLKK